LSWVFLSKVFTCQKEVWGYAKKERETHEALKIAKEKKKNNGTHEGSKVLKKRDTWSSQNSKRKEEKNGTHEGSKVLKKRDSPYFHGNY
jgi:predicted small secreted protein